MTMRDKVADLCHEQWNGWMVYLFGKSITNQDGSVTIPKELVERWRRQMNTPYIELSAKEKDSDKVEADKFIKLFASNAPKKTEADPRVKEVVELFKQYSLNIRGFEPEINWAVDGSMVKKHLGRFTVEQLTDLFEWYLRSDDCKRMGCSLKIVLSNYILNKWMISFNME
jgi:hypothetical protein